MSACNDERLNTIKINWTLWFKREPSAISQSDLGFAGSGESSTRWLESSWHQSLTLTSKAVPILVRFLSDIGTHG